MELGTIIALGISLLTLVLTRLDKAKKEGQDDNLSLINYQITEIKDDVKDILIKLDSYDSEIDKRIEKALELHIKLYHKRSKKNDI